MKRLFGIPEVARLSGLPASTLTLMIDQGVVTPAATRRSGKRVRRDLDEKAAFAIFVVAALRRIGIGPVAQSKVCKFLAKANLDAHFENNEHILVANNRQAFLALPTAIFTVERKQDQLAMLATIDLRQARELFRARLANSTQLQAAEVAASN